MKVEVTMEIKKYITGKDLNDLYFKRIDSINYEKSVISTGYNEQDGFFYYSRNNFTRSAEGPFKTEQDAIKSAINCIEMAFTN